MENRRKEITRDDLKLISEHQSYPKLIEEFRRRLDECRLAVDSIKLDKLLELQGRIQTYKDIINLFTEVYDGERE